MKPPMTGHEKASATKRVRYEDELLRREAKRTSTPLPKAWVAALKFACPRAGCTAERGEACDGRQSRRIGRPHAERILAVKEAKERAQARRELES